MVNCGCIIFYDKNTDGREVFCKYHTRCSNCKHRIDVRKEHNPFVCDKATEKQKKYFIKLQTEKELEKTHQTPFLLHGFTTK